MSHQPYVCLALMEHSYLDRSRRTCFDTSPLDLSPFHLSPFVFLPSSSSLRLDVIISSPPTTTSNTTSVVSSVFFIPVLYYISLVITVPFMMTQAPPRKMSKEAKATAMFMGSVEEDQKQSEDAYNSMPFNHGSPIERSRTETWVARLEAFRTHVLRADLATPFTGKDLWMFFQLMISKSFNNAIHQTNTSGIRSMLTRFCCREVETLPATSPNTSKGHVPTG